MSGVSDGSYQIPNNPNQPIQYPVPGATPIASSQINENQYEQNYYNVLAWQKSLPTVDFQISTFSRFSSLHFVPDQLGDLEFNGVASDVYRSSFLNGMQGDAAWRVTHDHTLHAGFIGSGEVAQANNISTVFPVNASGAVDGPPFVATPDTGFKGWMAPRPLRRGRMADHGAIDPERVRAAIRPAPRVLSRPVASAVNAMISPTKRTELVGLRRARRGGRRVIVFISELALALLAGVAEAPADEPLANAPLASALLPRDLSPWGMFPSADAVVKTVMIILVLASFVTWTVALAKGIEIFAGARKLARQVGVLERAPTVTDAAALFTGHGGLEQALSEARAEMVSQRIWTPPASKSAWPRDWSERRRAPDGGWEKRPEFSRRSARLRPSSASSEPYGA
jgi:hypothetical protein